MTQGTFGTADCDLRLVPIAFRAGQQSLYGYGFGSVADCRPCCMRVHIVDLARPQPRRLQCLSHGQQST